MAMPYMNGVQYKKPIQPELSREGRRTKNRKHKSADRAGTSGKSGPPYAKKSSAVLLLTDSSIRQVHVPNDDDDFVDPPPRFHETSSPRKSPTDEAPSAAHPSPTEPHSHGPQWSVVSCSSQL